MAILGFYRISYSRAAALILSAKFIFLTGLLLFPGIFTIEL